MIDKLLFCYFMPYNKDLEASRCMFHIKEIYCFNNFIKFLTSENKTYYMPIKDNVEYEKMMEVFFSSTTIWLDYALYEWDVNNPRQDIHLKENLNERCWEFNNPTKFQIKGV